MVSRILLFSNNAFTFFFEVEIEESEDLFHSSSTVLPTLWLLSGLAPDFAFPNFFFSIVLILFQTRPSRFSKIVNFEITSMGEVNKRSEYLTLL